ncbi:uncharacterized protein MELLADRAFT_62682 [Melampsora larici-populina 98AG31]|uniref:Uncharacterized protein n=1 Tax=Melampsora larici-populina (strain 98AG31 / pathotype 3-4-7) TaxID=747676 RepID=F4RJT6_MELLP|nr:uncharacterized protein MELLADRAFT_62682 [Melampsora larici-populina 98AG31]EGG07369.1 hypothetical protein MELLADRAFT_62682 [Melampsora larici-populina 98AG31]
MPRSSNNKLSRSKLLLGFIPKILFLSFLSFASTKDSEDKNSVGSIKKRCVFMDDGFELKDCGNAPTQSEFAEFLKRQAKEVARLAREFPCGYTYCPKFKRDLEFIYKSIEKHEDEVRLKSNSGDVSDENLDNRHITKEMLEETHIKTNHQNSEASDVSMKGVHEREPIKPSESLLLMAGPTTLQILISPKHPIYRAPEAFKVPSSKLLGEIPKTKEPKYEEKAEDRKEKPKTQSADYPWSSDQLDPEILKHLFTPDSYSLPPKIDQEMLKHSVTPDLDNSPPRIYNLPEPVSARAYNRVPDDFQETSSTSIDDLVQNLEPEFDEILRFIRIEIDE